MVHMTAVSDPCVTSIAAQVVPSPSAPPIAVIGLGRVGTVLSRALHAAGYPIVAVASRDPTKAASAANVFNAQPATPAEAAQRADLVLLTVPDDVLPDLAHQLADLHAWRKDQFVVHASGASPASVLQPAAEHGAITGSFHPVAAFASPDSILPSGITFGIEASEPLQGVLAEMARALGGYPLPLADTHKTVYHAAAVVASNYTVTLAAMAAQLFGTLGTSPEEALRALLPLMRTTLDNLEQQGLPDALTGPLVRGDTGTVQRHLEALDRVDLRIGAFYRCLGHATLPLAQQRGLDHATAGTIRDLMTLPSELVNEWETES